MAINTIIFFFLKEMNSFIQKLHIQKIKCDCKDNIITKSFFN